MTSEGNMTRRGSMTSRGNMNFRGSDQICLFRRVIKNDINGGRERQSPPKKSHGCSSRANGGGEVLTRLLYFSPQAVPLINILPSEEGNYHQNNVIFNNEGFLRKRSDARGKVTKMFAMNLIILKKFHWVPNIAC